MTIRNCMRLETQTFVWQEVQGFQSGCIRQLIAFWFHNKLPYVVIFFVTKWIHKKHSLIEFISHESQIVRQGYDSQCQRKTVIN